MGGLVDSVKALADESRLAVLWMLEGRSLCACEIQEALGLAQSTVSRHLAILEEAGFVVSEKRGQWKDYGQNPAPPPTVAGLLAVVRLAAAADSDALAVREKARAICREDLCARKGCGK